VVAISEAIQWTLKHQKGDQPNPPAPNTTYHIYTDSISSLYSMRNPLKSNASDYLIACIHMIASSSHNIQMKYIPAHKGYKVNEIADSLAKEGADNSHTLESIEPITDLRNQNKQKIKTLSAAPNYKNGQPLQKTTRCSTQLSPLWISGRHTNLSLPNARKYITLLWNQYP
jgi:ribonuclease HI